MDLDEFTLNVALGLEVAPPNFDYSVFASKPESNSVDEPESDEVCMPEAVVELDSDAVGEPDCVIVGVSEKSSLNKASSSNVQKEGEDGEDNVTFNSEDVPLIVVPFKDPKREECDVDDKVVPKREDSDVDDKDVDMKKKPPTAECDRRTTAITAFELEEKLKVGAEFPDLENVYLLYCEYARVKGFSVRKGEQRYFGRNTNNIRWKQFLCSCAGLPNYRSAKHKLGVYKKLVIRTDCKARLIVSRDDMGSYHVSLFDKEHNHQFVDCDQTLHLRSSRQMSYAKKSVLEALNSAGIGVSAASKFMAKENGGEENVGFIKKDAYHHMDRVTLQTRVEDGDARLLFDYFTEKSNAEPFFFWKYQLDDDGRLMNIFFRDNQCAIDYNAFGDVMYVDTTYRMNKYIMICVPFVGINHHTGNVMFGMAMLSDETTATFKWLFETFLQSMNGKQPKVIFTNQCRTMMNAIDVIFPNSKHRLSQWHITKNCASNFGKLLGDKSFMSLWYRCMNVVETEDDFNTTWKLMMENYEIANRSWYDGMHNLRERWASCFSRGIFTAGLLATSMNELTNKVLKDVVRSTVALSTFVKQYEGILNNWRSKERTDDAFGIWQPGQAVSHSGLLQKAASVFTHTIYKQFEHDLANCITLIVEPKNGVCLPNNIIQYTSKGREFASIERTTLFNDVTHVATCDCGKWETEGLICRHILRAFVTNNVDDIPDSMIYRRWTKRAKDLNFLVHQNLVESPNVFLRHMYELVSNAMQYPALHLKLKQRMKEVNDEFADLIRNVVTSQSEVRPRPPPITAPHFHDPRKICPGGFANVRKSNPSPSKPRKRAPESSPKSTPALTKRKVNPTSPPKTQEFNAN